MRRQLLAVLLIALGVVSAAHAAALDPSHLVLRRGDLRGVGWVPSANTGYRTAGQAAEGGPPGTAARLAKAGFVRGYDASWGAEAALVGSSAYVFRTVAGARKGFAVFHESQPPGTKRLAFARVGEESVAYRSRKAPRFTGVVWRNGRVVSVVLTGGLADNAILELVRIQKARVLAALDR
ncbi:MAG: hypothetical protein U0R50_07960 [Gaiellales bacterium]